MAQANKVFPFTYVNEKGRTVIKEHPFEGVVTNLQRRYRETDSMAVKEELAKFINEKECPSCHGARLRVEARFVKVGTGKQERAIYEISAMPLREGMEFFGKLKLTGAKRDIADRIIKEISSRLTFLNNVGLDLLIAGSQRRYFVGRRSAKDSSCLTNWIGLNRCDVRVGRTIDRLTST